MDEKIQMRKEILTIIKLSRTLEYTDKKRVQQVVNFATEKSTFSTRVGTNYINRLNAILQDGDFESTCVICNKNHAENSVICNECTNTIGNILDKENQAVKINYSNKELDRNNTIKDNHETVLNGNNTKEIFTEAKKQIENGLKSELGKSVQEVAKKGYSNLVTSVNKMTGEEGTVQFRLRDLISKVFIKHEKKESDLLFIAGTEITTPLESEISKDWPKPWLYSRVMILLLAVYYLLLFMYNNFDNRNALPGIMFIGAMAIPFSLIVFFWELNVPRNISIIDVVKVFFLGGVLSLIITLYIDEVLYTGKLVFWGAFLTGIAEETGKGIVTLCYLRKTKYKYILNGLLIGAAVGAGFAVFETAGYAFKIMFIYGVDESVMNLTVRGILSFGGHIMWTALIGAGIVIVKGNEELKKKHIMNIKFLKFWMISVVLHAIWDSPLVNWLPKIGEFYFVHITLVVLIWIIDLTVISAGLRQITRFVNKAINNNIEV